MLPLTKSVDRLVREEGIPVDRTELLNFVDLERFRARPLPLQPRRGARVQQQAG
jgi:hypothetical protein